MVVLPINAITQRSEQPFPLDVPPVDGPPASSLDKLPIAASCAESVASGLSVASADTSDGGEPLRSATPSRNRTRGRRRLRPPILGELDLATAPAAPDADEFYRSSSAPCCRPLTCKARKRPTLMLTEGLSPESSPRSSPNSLAPITPPANREQHRQLKGGVSIIFFDFDGTLTATPGELSCSHRQKKSELCERAPMMLSRMSAFREAGATLGIISKSTEATVRDALLAADLTCYFRGPIVGNAVGFEGKVGFIEELAMQGLLPGFSRRGLGMGPSRWALVRERILLVDDDVRELQRAAAGGVQTYAAPAEGGIRACDLDAILEAVRHPFRLHPGRTWDGDEVLHSPTAGLLSPAHGLQRATAAAAASGSAWRAPASFLDVASCWSCEPSHREVRL
eukprot:TRINITY_DN33051_c0_g1_i1.p1 TRINITY_DN33051_c0_g1~~TRINITY_DN33051_c0_g1_i1.p1  ORF type:complete len:404 (+),score=52.44 TRINITY_DN33051_c0_g1_i1:26-1213(+)